MAKPYEISENNPIISYDDLRVFLKGVELLLNARGVDKEFHETIITIEDRLETIIREIGGEGSSDTSLVSRVEKMEKNYEGLEEFLESSV